MVVVPKGFGLLNLQHLAVAPGDLRSASANERRFVDRRSGVIAKCQLPGAACYRFAVPRTIFFTLRFADPRAYSRGFNGFSVFFFLRTARLAFLRSSLVNLLVFAMSAVCLSSEKLAVSS